MKGVIKDAVNPQFHYDILFTEIRTEGSRKIIFSRTCGVRRGIGGSKPFLLNFIKISQNANYEIEEIFYIMCIEKYNMYLNSPYYGLYKYNLT